MRRGAERNVPLLGLQPFAAAELREYVPAENLEIEEPTPEGRTGTSYEPLPVAVAYSDHHASCQTMRSLPREVFRPDLDLGG
jgi:hypothetical protein